MHCYSPLHLITINEIGNLKFGSTEDVSTFGTSSACSPSILRSNSEQPRQLGITKSSTAGEFSSEDQRNTVRKRNERVKGRRWI